MGVVEGMNDEGGRMNGTKDDFLDPLGITREELIALVKTGDVQAAILSAQAPRFE